MGAPDASPNGRRIIAQGTGNPADAAKAARKGRPPHASFELRDMAILPVRVVSLMP